MLTDPIYLSFVSKGCDIARACEGYITFEDTKQGSYNIGPLFCVLGRVDESVVD